MKQLITTYPGWARTVRGLLTVWLSAWTLSLGAESIVQSYDQTGTLTWTNNVHLDGRYQVEWATSLEGPWRRTWQNLDSIQAQTQTVFSVEIPRFYRVSMATNFPPTGMSLVDAGVYIMGDDGLSDGWLSAEPMHAVDVPAFYMDRFEVTNGQMCDVLNWATAEGLVGWYGTHNFARNLEGNIHALLLMDEPGCRISFDGLSQVYEVDEGAENLPCVQVTWHGALAYCNYRSDMEGLERTVNFFGDFSIDYTKGGYRLPTEAEWEKAARGGLQGNFYPWTSFTGVYSDHLDGTKANYADSGDPYSALGDQAVAPVGYYNGSQHITNTAGVVLSGVDMANGYGLYNMAGNVWELCTDRPNTSYVGAPTDGSSVNGVEVNHRIMRGGSFRSSAKKLLCSDRHDILYQAVGYRSQDDAGFRCVRRAP